METTKYVKNITESKRAKIQEQVQSIVNNIYYCYNTSPDVISVIARFVDGEIEKIENRKNKPKNHAGVQRNDLKGNFKVIGNKIYVRYKGQDYATKCNNTASGWKLANKWWEQKIEEIDAILSGEKEASDTIKNVFQKFIEHKIQYDKITNATIKTYEYRIKIVFGDYLNELLTEKIIKIALDNFITKTKLSPTTINNVLVGVQIFFKWVSDDEQQYIAPKYYIKKYKQSSPKKIRPPYTEEEYLMFIDYFENETKHEEMSLLLQFLWNTGARIGESLNIKIADIDFKNNYIIIPNKKFKSQQETLLLTDETKEIIQKIITLKQSKTDKLFSWSSKVTPIKNLENAESKLEIKIRGRAFHGFRRSFADRLFNSGFDMPEIQEAMRHRTINTTLEHYKSFNKTNIIKKLNEKLK